MRPHTHTPPGLRFRFRLAVAAWPGSLAAMSGCDAWTDETTSRAGGIDWSSSTAMVLVILLNFCLDYPAAIV